RRARPLRGAGGGGLDRAPSGRADGRRLDRSAAAGGPLVVASGLSDDRRAARDRRADDEGSRDGERDFGSQREDASPPRARHAQEEAARCLRVAPPSSPTSRRSSTASSTRRSAPRSKRTAPSAS